MERWQVRNAEDFGTAVRAARRQEGLTQRQLALAVGAGERFIVELEGGKETVRLGKAFEVARALGIEIDLIREA